ncbi:MAG TPA: pyridoxamine 5'-phosphate oxidase [Microbacteriaceae bacterium]|nr:pyridoxamine 5'-phosphate oxidase [Microbacteriaceae bacterium]
MAHQDDHIDLWSPQGPVRLLTEAESWELLDGSTFGRLAVSVANQPEIFPINYYADGDTILFRTSEGTKLLELTINSSVALETDAYTDEWAWSVIVKGHAKAIENQEDIFEADQLPLTPWIPTLKYIYVRITPTEITGRRFLRAPEPERY